MFTAKTPGTDVTSPTGKVTFIPAGIDDGSVLVLDPAVSPATITLTRPENGPITTWSWDTTDPDDPGWTLEEADSDGDGQSGTEVEVDSDGAYLTWISETEAGISATCTAATQEAGCRGLKLSYTGTGTNKRVTKIDRLTVKSDGTTATETQATYAYTTIDSISLLTKACGPDPDGTGSQDPLCTDYAYDITTMASRVLLAKVTPPGQKAWRYDYDSTGRLTTVKRAYDADTNTDTGDAVWSVLYDLDPTINGLPNLTAAEANKWGQDHLPVKAFAVFEPDAPARDASHLDWAQLWWTDETGAVTNTAVHGNADGTSQWLVDTTWYDDHGNTVQTLDADGRAAALTETTLEDQQSVAHDASSLTIYNNDGDDDPGDGDGRRVEAEYGPAHTATLKNGTTGTYRSATTYAYDEEAPSLGGSGKPAYSEGKTSFNLIVETRRYAALPDTTGAFDAQITRNNYGPLVDGDENGWDTGSPTRTEVQSTDGSWHDTTLARNDANGRQIESRQPGGATSSAGAGTDAHSTVFSYYTRGNTDPDCNITGHAERAGWGDLACKTGPASQPNGTSVPVTYNSAYNVDLQPTTTIETSGTVTRTTTAAYDQLGRPTSSKIQVTGTTNQDEIIQTMTEYDAVTGLPVIQKTLGTSNQIRTEYDSWGRKWTYTDASGNEAITTYTPTSQIATFNDGAGTYTYAYNGTVGEHRGLATSVDLGTASGTSDSVTMTYDGAGAITELTYPNGMTETYTYDAGSGVATALGYATTDAEGNPMDLAAFAASTDVDGRVLEYVSRASSQAFTYDSLGRLTQTEDTREDGCTTRTYGYSAASDRTSFASYAPSAGDPTTGDGAGFCQDSTPTSSRSNTYDDAGRTTNAGYTYDPLGRTLTVPAADMVNATSSTTFAYRANDMIKTMSQELTAADGTASDVTKTYTLDAAGRIQSITTTIDGAQSGHTAYRYASSSDSPTAVMTSTSGGETQTTRYLAVPGTGMIGEVVAGDVTFQIANLHGDVVATTSAADATPSLASYSETDEFGRPATGQGSRYGYLGRLQRAGGNDTLGGTYLMGARVYNPTSGQFNSVDSVHGGNATPYSYPNDPANELDPNGRWCVAGVGTTCTRYATDSQGWRIPVRAWVRAKLRNKHGISWTFAKFVIRNMAFYKMGNKGYYIYFTRVIERDWRLRRTGRKVQVRTVIDWGKSSDGKMMGVVSMYCVLRRGHLCPSWIYGGAWVD